MNCLRADIDRLRNHKLATEQWPGAKTFAWQTTECTEGADRMIAHIVPLAMRIALLGAGASNKTYLLNYWSTSAQPFCSNEQRLVTIEPDSTAVARGATESCMVHRYGDIGR